MRNFHRVLIVLILFLITAPMTHLKLVLMSTEWNQRETECDSLFYIHDIDR